MTENEGFLAKARETVLTTSIAGLVEIKRPTFKDERGFFGEIYHQDEVEAVTGIPFVVAEEKLTFLRTEAEENSHVQQGNELIYPVRGTIEISITDSRDGSMTNGKSEVVKMDSQESRSAIFIPEGVTRSLRVVGDRQALLVCLRDKETDEKTPLKISQTEISGLFIIDCPKTDTEIGESYKIFSKGDLLEYGEKEFSPCQANHSLSYKDVLRAIHTEGWNKYVCPTTGKMCAKVVDADPQSPTFMKIVEVNFDTSKGIRAMFVPKGLGNSICVTGSDVNYIYLVDAYYTGKDTSAIAYDDPDLKISWPIKNPIISDRDKNNKPLRELFPEKFK